MSAIPILLAHEAVYQHVRRLSIFDHVGKFEPLNPPGKGIYAALTFRDGGLRGELSSLAAAGGGHVLKLSMYKTEDREPKDEIDLDLIAALDAVVASLVSDHTLGGTAYSVDVLGAYGDGISWSFTETDFRRNQWFRVVDLFIPVTFEGEYPYAG